MLLVLPLFLLSNDGVAASLSLPEMLGDGATVVVVVDEPRGVDQVFDPRGCGLSGVPYSEGGDNGIFHGSMGVPRTNGELELLDLPPFATS